MNKDELISLAAELSTHNAGTDGELRGEVQDIKQLLYLLIVATVDLQEKLDYIKMTSVWGPKI